MLQALSVADVQRETIEIDPYIPLNIKWDCNTNKIDLGKLYWRTGDFKTSLLEVSLEPHSGTICSITLVAWNILRTKLPKRMERDIPQQYGRPVFNISDFSSDGYDVYDCAGSFTVYFEGDKIYVLFVEDVRKVTSMLVNGRVRFGLDDQNALCWIGVNNLTKNEIEQLKMALDR
ncbi:hypothetical protein JQC72_06680 [Polycladomyces sp. WAk]|uniref:Uncharacterized protein n=1 Tax=Polycladomyces zharkentensis TaxID=2807616 RepID=A0ABS2WI52_9BACL|nr:hypothetical protein [Polycladomyces sp. WAk]MBN2909207.1 hypothetical protein [Polycladomyces sp. WAk]